MNRLLTALLLVVPFTAQAADHQVQSRLAVPHQAGASYSFENLAGTVTVTSYGGDEIIIQANVIGATEALAQSVTLQRDGNAIWMDYPVREHGRFLYQGRGHSSTTLTYRGQRVEVSSRGRGAEVHAVVQVTVPHGTVISLHNAVGSMRAEDTRGALTLRSGSGSLTVSRHTGALEVRAGSGSVTINGIIGDLSARTGSGSIRIEDLAGARSLAVTTGSGSTRINGDLSTVSSMNLSAGSGSVTVDSTGIPNVRLNARAGSGSVRVDVDGMRDVETGRSRLSATLGDGSGEATIRTGSGSIRFTAR